MLLFCYRFCVVYSSKIVVSLLLLLLLLLLLPPPPPLLLLANLHALCICLHSTKTPPPLHSPQLDTPNPPLMQPPPTPPDIYLGQRK